MGAGAVGELVFGKGGISSDLKASGQQRYAEKIKDLQALSRETDSLNTSWERAKSGDIGALQDWAAYGLGYIGGQAIQALATAGVGSIAGKLVLRPAVASLMEGMVAKETAALAGTKAAEGLTAEGVGKLATANVAGRIGQNTALAVTAGGMEGGEIFGDLVSEANREGRDLTGYELARAFGMTIAAGSLEFLGDRLGVVDIVMGKSRLAAGMTGPIARGIFTAAESAAIEGSTEFAQTLLEQVGKGKDPFSQASIRDAIDAAALGVLGGTVIGGASGALRGAPTADPTVDPTAQIGTPPGMPPETPLGIPPRTNTVAPGDEISAGTTLTREVDRAIQESSDSIGTQSSLPMTLAGVTPESLDQVIREAEAQASPGAQTVAPEAPAHSIADIHALATESNIPWDDDPAFMTFTETVTGKRHLDELTPQERDTLYAALEARVQAKSETIAGEPTRTPVPPVVNEPSTTIAQEAEATRQAAIQAERARLQALAVPLRAAATIDKEIDALETQLEQQGIDVIHLYDATEPGNDVLKGYKDYQPMPEELARLYRERNAVYAKDQINFREKTIADSGLPPKEAGEALDALYLHEKGLAKTFSDVLRRWKTNYSGNLTALYNHFAAIKYEDFEMYYAKFAVGGTADAPVMTGKVVRGRGPLDPELLRKTEQVYNAVSRNIGAQAISLSRLGQLANRPGTVDVTPVETTDPTLIPRNQLPDAANADMLARAEKGEADLASLAGTDTRSLLQFLRDRGGVQDQGKELTNLGVDTNRKPFQKRLIQATGLTLDDAAEAAHEAGLIPSRDMNLLLQAIDRELRQGTGPAWITEATTGSGEKLTRARVDAAIQKILVDEGQDVGKDVARVKALLLADPEFASSGFALKTDADVQAMITEAKAGQQEIPVPPPTIGERPIYGAEKPLEDMPLFSKEAQTPAPEQTELLPTAPAETAPVVVKPTRPLPKGASPVTAAEPTAPSTAAAAEKKALQALKLKNMLSKQKKAPAAPSDTPSTAAQALDTILTDEEKRDAAASLGMGTTWTNEVAETFLSRYAAWVQAGAKNLGTRLGVLFKKVLDAAKTGILALAVIINLSAPISITSATIPLTSTTIESSLATPRANFSGQSPSTEMRVIADWAVRTQQSKGKPFLLVDKKAGYLYVFNKEGVLDATAPVLLGLTKADALPAGREAKALEEFLPEDKVTPAGVFAATFDPTNAEYGTALKFSEQDKVILMVHRVYLGNESREQRQARLDTETGEDNRISFGCLNVTRAFMRDVINPSFKDGGVVIIAPEMSDPNTFFGITRPATPQPAQDQTSASLGALAIMGMTRKKETPETPGFLPAIPPAEIDSQRLTDVIMLGQTLWDMEPITFEDWYVTMADGLDADHLPYLSAAWNFLLERPVARDLREAQLKPLLDYAVKLATQGVVEREAFLARFTKFLGQKTSAPYAEGLFAAIFNPREVFDDIAIRNQQQANQPSGGLLDETGRGGAGTDPVDVPTPPVGDGARADEEERLPGERPGPVADPTDRGSGGPGVGLPGADLSGGRGTAGRKRNQKSGLPTERGGAAPGGLGGEVPGVTGLETGISVEEKADAVTEKTDSSYVPYESPLNIPGQQPHPGAVVESASLASTKLPPTTYVPNLPKEIIEKGLLSSVQLVPIVYAGQSHAKILPDGTRQGYFIGDGTGIGKGR
ncbi:MAG: strawberry notch family protein, partial [Nitrosarchaeum sp.]|nr:strawberry notch family protein [Nitrosarchaeum sp.]